MLSILKAPFPSNYGSPEKIRIAILVGIFVGLFLGLYKPFGMDEHSWTYPILPFVGFGVVSTIGMLIVDYIIPKLVPSFFVEENFTVFKELIIGALIVLVVGLGNSLYLKYILGQDFGLVGVLSMIWTTFLVGIFPLTLLTLLNYNKLLKSNMRTSNEINVQSPELSVKNLKSEVASTSTIVEIEDGHQFDLSGLCYMESVGNYINVTSTNEGEFSRQLYRSTLKSIEQVNKLDQILRCHRSFIVNLDKVKKVSGNAQGLKLTLENCKDIVPVSRKYIKEVKDYFEQKSLEDSMD